MKFAKEEYGHYSVGDTYIIGEDNHTADYVRERVVFDKDSD